MTAYCIWDNTEVSDPTKMEEYVSRVAPLVEKHNGRYLVVGGKFEAVEGEWPLTYPVIITFPSMSAAKGWYNSKEYADLKLLRQSASKANAIFIEGMDIQS